MTALPIAFLLGISPVFLLIIVATMLLSGWASMRVRSNFQRFSQVPLRSGLTGAEVARRVMAQAGINDVEIVQVQGTLTDHYDPVNKRLALSEGIYDGVSVAAAGVAAHEAGHAIQDKVRYPLLHARMGMVGIVNIASQAVMWIPLLAMATHILAPKTAVLLMAVGFGIITLFQFITLPVEFDASARAKNQLLALGMIDNEEGQGVSKVLGAAAWTYVAAFISSLATMLYYVLPMILGRRDEN